MTEVVAPERRARGGPGGTVCASCGAASIAGVELGQHGGGVDDDGQHPGERPQSDGGHEEQRVDQRVHRAEGVQQEPRPEASIAIAKGGIVPLQFPRDRG